MPGQDSSSNTLLPVVYDDLRKLARGMIRTMVCKR
jgi:hypothetical protein